MQALMLAAGMGRRLGKYTDSQTKCMVKVGGKTLLEHTIDSLKYAGIKKFIVVIGYECDRLVNFITENIKDMDFEFIYNHDYEKTNNIYSLYLAKDYLTQDDTILLESDLIYDKKLIRDVVNCKDENIVVVAKYEHWMDGTVTIINEDNYITEFVEKKDFLFKDVDSYYKTVNIYKFSKGFSKTQYIPFLKAYIQAYGNNQYYELVLKALAHLSNAKLKAFKLQDIKWYEIDDAQDLDIANTIFARDEDKIDVYSKHFGGYWRFSGVKDFCYLVNPYFPPNEMNEKFKYFFNTLITQYPSGMYVQKINVSRMFNIDEQYVLAGNGAAEIISALGKCLKGKMSVCIPSFNEYVRCFNNCDLNFIYTAEDNFNFNKARLLNAIEESDIITIVNPDNPSGSFLNYNDMLEIISKCEEKNVICIIDESFVDFANVENRYTLIDNHLLKKYKKLIVIKSISKSYGVPGLRLGVVASSDVELLDKLKNTMAIWNINSFAEYFLQIITLFENKYFIACDKIAEQRNDLDSKLKSISFLNVFYSQANYIMCEVIDKFTSRELANKLIKEHNILIKDLSNKDGFFEKQYIRIAVKDEFENKILYNALEKFDLI